MDATTCSSSPSRPSASSWSRRGLSWRASTSSAAGLDALAGSAHGVDYAEPRSARRRCRRILEEATREDDRVWKNDHASRRLERVADQLLQLDSYEADLGDLAMHVPEGTLQAHPVSHTNPVRRDHREVAGDGQDDVLQRKGDPGRCEAEGGDQRRHFAGEVKYQHERDRDRDDDAPHGQQQTPAPGGGPIPITGTPPH